MKLTTKGRYAVMAMVEIALADKQEPIALFDVASRKNISLSYLEQLCAALRKSELIDSVRGPGGGYHLAKSASHITILEIMTAVDEQVDVMVDDKAPTAKIECPTHNLWEGLEKQIQHYLETITLEDVCRGNLWSGPLFSENTKKDVAHG